MANACISVDKEEHPEDVLMDQAKKEMKKDDTMPSFSRGLGLSQPNNQSPVPQTTSMRLCLI